MGARHHLVAIAGIGAVLSAWAGCGGSNGSTASGNDGGPCQTDAGYPADANALGAQAIGSSASGDAGGPALTFILENDVVGDAASPPTAPSEHVFTLKLADSKGQPVTDATVSLPTNDQALGWPYPNPWIPCLGHGSSISTLPVTNNGDGTYSIPVYFTLPGVWSIYIVANIPGGVTDSAIFSLRIQ